MKKQAYLLLALAIIMFFTAGCGQQTEATPTVDPALLEDFSPVVSATGVVVPAQWATLSLSSAGVVDEFLVAEGDTVEQDQLLLVLGGNEAAQAAVAGAQLEMLSATKAYDDLFANHEVIRAQAELELAQAKIALDDAEEERERKNFRRASNATIDGLRADFVLAKEALDKAEEAFEGVADRDEDDAIRAQALSALSNARKAYDRALQNLNYALGLPDAEEVEEAEAQLALAQARLDKAQVDYDKVKDGPDPEQLAIAEARVENAQKQLASAQKTLQDQTLTAPFAGVVSRLYLREQEWGMAGEPVLQIADLANLRVETTDLSEIDVASVSVGDTATITFDALPDVVVEGVVQQIAPRADEGSGVNYKVVLELNTIPAGLRWGMTAFVDIEIGDS